MQEYLQLLKQSSKKPTNFQWSNFMTFTCLSIHPITRPTVCLSIHLSTYLPVCLSIHLSYYLSVYMPDSAFLSACLLVNLPTCLFFWMSVYLPACLSVFLTVYLPVCLYVCCLPVRVSVSLYGCSSICLSVTHIFFNII
jgi:hypothetical protein